METAKMDSVDFQMNSPHLISQDEKTYQMEMLMNMKNFKTSAHKSCGKVEENLTHGQKKGAISSFSISGVTT